MGRHTDSGLGGFMSGASIRFSKMRGGSGGADAWRDSLMFAKNASNSSRPKTTGTKLPILHSVHRGTVVSVQPFGCFVQLGNGEEYKDGLVHISCISATERPERVEDYLAMGDTVWVKVTEDLKYSLDMRYVNQKDGTPLYKNNRDDSARATKKVSLGLSLATARDGPCTAGTSLADTSLARSSEASIKSESRQEGADQRSLALQQPLPSDSESSDSEEQRKVQKKLQKAAKKLEKVRRKAEKVKKKLKKEKKAKASSGSQDSEMS